MKQPERAVFGYRFTDPFTASFYRLYAVGYDLITADQDYDWDGLKRIDGPLYLLQYTVSGRGNLDIGGHTHSIGPGEAFMVEIPSEHRYYLPQDSERWEFYFILFRPAGLERLWREAIDKLGCVAALPAQSRVVAVLKELYLEAAAGRIADSYTASALVYRFMIELLRHSDIGLREQKEWPEPVRRAAELMARHAGSDIGMDEIARGAGVSKYHFTRVFSKATGQTPIHYMTKLRMKRAIELLRGSELSIEEIAQQTGYASGSYFSRVFKQWVGFSPSEFRAGRDLIALQQVKFD